MRRGPWGTSGFCSGTMIPAVMTISSVSVMVKVVETQRMFLQQESKVSSIASVILGRGKLPVSMKELCQSGGAFPLTHC